METRDIGHAYSENLPSLLAELKCSLLLSTYQTGNLVVVSAPDGQPSLTYHTFDRPMGLATKPDWLALATRNQVWFLRNAPDIAAKLEPRGQYDSCYLARGSHFTGNIQCHEMAWIGSDLWLVNTLFSCLCTCHPAYSFEPRWRPRFISALAAEDRCHLNGLAAAEGKARYVTALGETDTPQGWRPGKAGGGCLIDVATSETVVRSLTMPHSPRLADGRVYLLDSGLGRLVTADPANGQVESIAQLPGYTRGLSIHGHLAFVGLSKIRATSSLAGVPIAAHPEGLKCGVAVVDLRSGQVTASFEFSSGIDELFAVQVLPDSARPLVSGPLADRDGGQTLWTVPPAARGPAA
jgi:uncharacterized protein (TIGR03032 family)